MKRYTIPFEQLAMKDVSLVGGKNASLGEMIANLSSLGIITMENFRREIFQQLGNLFYAVATDQKISLLTAGELKMIYSGGRRAPIGQRVQQPIMRRTIHLAQSRFSLWVS